MLVLKALVLLPVVLSLSSIAQQDNSPLPLKRSVESSPEPVPRPPCGTAPIPDYPGLNNSAEVKAWGVLELGRTWEPPACTNWKEPGFSTLVTVSARFSFSAGEDGLLRRVGAISELTGLQYWSTTHKRWQTLVVDAYAVSGPESSLRRQDFAPDEMKLAKPLYFVQADNLSGKALYRMQVYEANPDRIVFGIENVNTMRYHLIPIFHPGELQSVYFLDRESDQVWRYYCILRSGKNVNRLLAGNESSSINRAVAFYRHLVGISPTQEPPAAR